MHGRVAVLILAGFFDCGGGSTDGGNDGDVEDNPVNQGAWQTGRIMYANNAGNGIVTINDDGTERQTLIEVPSPVCPTIAKNSSRIMAQLEETDEWLLVRKSGSNTLIELTAGMRVGNVALGAEGEQAIFEELMADAGDPCIPTQLFFGRSDGADVDPVAGDEQTCARWPEFSDDGDTISYQLDDPSSGTRDICLLEGHSGADLGCLGITDMNGARAFDPDGIVLMANDFRTWRTSDGAETSDPILEIEDLMPPEGQNDIRARVEAAMAAEGIGVLESNRFPISLDWGPNRTLVFDAVTDGPDGPGVHIFTFQLETDELFVIGGPFVVSGTNNHERSILCPRWMP